MSKPSHNLTLYVDSLRTSPYAMSAFVTLREKGLPFELRSVDLEAGENLGADYCHLSLTRKVPLLLHDHFHLNESSAITEYLEDHFEPPVHAAVYPVDLKQKARARQVQAWLRSDLIPIRMERSTEGIFLGKRFDPLSAAATQARDKLVAAADRLIEDGHAHLFPTWSIADVDLALMLNRLVMHGDAMPEKLKTYAARQWEHPAVQEWAAMQR
ncbi:MAG: glutathione transferase [Burkholderiaceae bacterium]|nr:glutathione transferase [Burkholderiaceae bacterium]